MEKQSVGYSHNLQVIIPYKDYENIVSSARKIEHIEAEFKQLQKRYDSLHGLYYEILEKVQEIDRYL